MPLTLEYDDFPRDAGHFLKMVDWLRKRYAGFKATAFAIPAEMTNEHWLEVDKRRDFLAVAPHGFEHRHWECTEPASYEPKLDELCKDDRWTRLCKAPWYEYSPDFIQALHEREFAFALKTMHPIPYPAPDWWRCWDRWFWASRDGDDCHIRTHPRTQVRKRMRRSHSLTKENVAEWAKTWGNKGWLYAHEALTPVRQESAVDGEDTRIQTARHDTVWCELRSVDVTNALRAVRPGGEVRIDTPYTRPVRLACEELGIAATIQEWQSSYLTLHGPMAIPPLQKTRTTLKKWLRR